MSKTVKGVIMFAKEHKWICALTAIVIVLSFGFMASNYTINIDNLHYEYADGLDLLSQGRVTAPLIQFFTGIFGFSPFWIYGIAMLGMFVSAVTWAFLLQDCSGGKLGSAALMVFSLVFVSYPLMNEIFVYAGASVYCCWGYAIIAVALQLARRFMTERKISSFIAAVLLLFLIISAYESFAGVFLTSLFILGILDVLSGRQDNKKLLLSGLAALMIAVLLYFLVRAMLMQCISTNSVAQNAVVWRAQPISETICGLLTGFFRQYILAAFSYLPIFVLMLSVITCISGGVILSMKRRSVFLLFLFLGMIASLFAMSVFSGSVIPYRASQNFALFTAFTAALLMQWATPKRLAKWACVAALGILVINQSRDLNNWFVRTYERYTVDVAVCRDIAEELDNRPVIFVGEFPVPESLRLPTKSTHPLRVAVESAVCAIVDGVLPSEQTETLREILFNTNYNQVCCQDMYVNWGSGAFNGRGADLFRFFERLGYSFSPFSDEQYAYATAWYKAGGMENAPPDGGYIYDLGECVVVDLQRYAKTWVGTT